MLRRLATISVLAGLVGACGVASQEDDFEPIITTYSSDMAVRTSQKIDCGYAAYELEYEEIRAPRPSGEGWQGEVSLVSFSSSVTNDVELIEKTLASALDGYQSLQGIKFHCGGDINGDPDQSLTIEFLGLHHGNINPHKEKCRDQGGVFDMQTMRSFTVRADSVNTNVDQGLGSCSFYPR